MSRVVLDLDLDFAIDDGESESTASRQSRLLVV